MSGAAGRFAPISEEGKFLVAVGMNERVKTAFKSYNEFISSNPLPADAPHHDINAHYTNLFNEQSNLMKVLFRQGVITEEKMKQSMQHDEKPEARPPAAGPVILQAGPVASELVPEIQAPAKKHRKRVKPAKSSSDEEGIPARGSTRQASRKRAAGGAHELPVYNFRPRSTNAARYTQDDSEDDQPPSAAPLSQDRRAQIRAQKKRGSAGLQEVIEIDD